MYASPAEAMAMSCAAWTSLVSEVRPRATSKCLSDKGRAKEFPLGMSLTHIHTHIYIHIILYVYINEAALNEQFQKIAVG
jgi:hypothetical protein